MVNEGRKDVRCGAVVKRRDELGEKKEKNTKKKRKNKRGGKKMDFENEGGVNQHKKKQRERVLRVYIGEMVVVRLEKGWKL